MTIPTPTASNFRREFPEFTEQDYPDPVVTTWITRAGYIHSITQQGWLLLTAHLLTIAKADGALDGVAEPDEGKGLVTMKTLGEKSRAFTYGGKNVKDAMEFYKRTFYGRTFIELEKRTAATGISVRVFE